LDQEIIKVYTMKYHKLDCFSLPDELFNKETNVNKWLALTTTVNGKFPPSSLNKVAPIDRIVEIERIIGIALYMIGNTLIFALPILILAAVLTNYIGMICLKLFIGYFGILFTLSKFYFFPYFIKKYNRPKELSNDIRDNQYLHTERNNQKYTSLRFVWPDSISRPSLDDSPVIFCCIPHGAGKFVL